MAVTIEDSNTQASVIGTEHTLSTLSTAKVFVLVVDTVNMALGDILELRLYVMALAGGTARVAYYAAFTHNQDDEPIKISIPVTSPGRTNGFKATLKQTAGTGRNFDWDLLSVG